MISVVLAHVESNIADHVQPFDLAPAGYSAIDHAWNLGYDAAMESLDFEDVFPPADLTPAEAVAFRSGAREGFRQLDWEMEQSRTPMCEDDADDMYDSWVREREARDAFIGHDSSESW